MKSLFLIAAAVCLVLTGCGEPNLDASDLDDPKTLDKILSEATHSAQVLARGPEGAKICYVPNSHVPYTGWVKEMYANEQVKELGHYKDGKLDGHGTEWHENGRKKEETHWKDGNLVSETTWDENGNRIK